MDRANPTDIAKFFVVCDQEDTTPVWGYILRQQGLSVILETSLEKAIERCSTEMPDLVVLNLDVDHKERMELYQKFRCQTLESLAHIVEKSEKVRDCSR